MIEFRKVNAGRPGVPLIHDFDWRIGRGENWLVQGSNGSGKTLLLELLAGKIHPSAGELKIDFIDGASWDERYAQRKRFIHYVPTHAVQSLLKQDHHQYYQQRYYSIGDQQQPSVRDVLGATDEALAALDLPEEFSIERLLDVDANRLSNGQLKKLLLIKVLLSGMPKLMLFDYPFEGLDRASRLALCRFMDFLAGQHGMQLVLVDQHNELPGCLNKVLTVDRFRATGASRDVAVREVRHNDGSPGNDLNNASPSSDTGTDPVVEVIDLKIQYGDHVILRDFNWRVNRGERWALVGRNGAGKTTLFSMIFADHPMAYSQNVYLFGRKRGTGESIWDIKRRISYLGPEQLSYLSPSAIYMSARDYLARALKHADKHRFDHLAKVFGAEEFLELPVRVLSSGQLQVVLIMQCLLSDCELLLLDEPFQFLDTERKAALNEVLTSYLDKDKTLILITHYAADLGQWTSFTKHL